MCGVRKWGHGEKLLLDGIFKEYQKESIILALVIRLRLQFQLVFRQLLNGYNVLVRFHNLQDRLDLFEQIISYDILQAKVDHLFEDVVHVYFYFDEVCVLFRDFSVLVKEALVFIEFYDKIWIEIQQLLIRKKLRYLLLKHDQLFDNISALYIGQ